MRLLITHAMDTSVYKIRYSYKELEERKRVLDLVDGKETGYVLEPQAEFEVLLNLISILILIHSNWLMVSAATARSTSVIANRSTTAGQLVVRVHIASITIQVQAVSSTKISNSYFSKSNNLTFCRRLSVIFQRLFNIPITAGGKLITTWGEIYHDRGKPVSTGEFFTYLDPIGYCISLGL